MYKRYITFNNSRVTKSFFKIYGYNYLYDGEDVSSLAPIRAKPLPLYSGGKKGFNAEGEHIPFMLREKLSGEGVDLYFLTALNKYGKESGLFDNLNVLAYRDEKTSPFELIVEKSKSKYKISAVGYGVSQILPIISELIINKNLIMIQQPEVHLHPKAQAAFGAFLYKMARKSKKRKFIIETHSDYIIDRFRYQKKTVLSKIPSQVLFFKNNGKHNIVTTIDIQDDGKYNATDKSFEDFRAFFIDESFRIMEI